MGEQKPRPTKSWPNFIKPVLLPVTGFRDQTTRVTYFPWSDPEMGLVGWELLPDRSTRRTSVVVYVVPSTSDDGVLEVRCHVAYEEPNPETDPLLGTVIIPPDKLGMDEP
jgi:hypothetical protein